MGKVLCPDCGGSRVELKSPDYGQGSEWVCLDCNRPYGHRFISSSPEARSASSAARALSRSNAEAMKGGQNP